ncbi:hypothetical protein [Microbulbifer donghaiensis]|uniref:hypothetical protein n=1 Tax=Microbulbifer donghaiensis TaxID=494016 RepID=UPI001160E6B4|nr:hypothetical protein [Microbulbifer donghaiensis]
MEFSKNLVVAAWFAAAIALITDLLGYTADIALFGRAGAVMTLCAVVLEYKLSTKGQADTDYIADGPVSLGDVGKATLLTEAEKKIQRGAHVSVVVGTIIWGFGDLITRMA